ncbi:proline dehydrogenase [Cystoisospora suis]|uniref:Proline dehydrogenase n=1 Tax=Cystoisospora suis TaxID=483139 RepID=A0A2C6L9X9_9APIC|nr:proline dehydrogenase [Cystoisospora suis]
MGILRYATPQRTPCWTTAFPRFYGHAAGTSGSLGGATGGRCEREFSVMSAAAGAKLSEGSPCSYHSSLRIPLVTSPNCERLVEAGGLGGRGCSPLLNVAGVRQQSLRFWGPHCFVSRRTVYDVAQPVGCAPRLSKSALSFEGPEAGSLCTQGKSWRDLLVSATVFGVCASPWLVRNSQTLLDISSRVIGQPATMWLLKHSFYRVFCGGEDLAEVRLTMDSLQKRGVRSVLDYAVEASPDDAAERTETYEENVRLTWDAIDTAASEADGFAAVKVTALGPTPVMERASIVIANVERLFVRLLGEAVEEQLASSSCHLITKELTREQFVSGMQELRKGVGAPEASAAELNKVFDCLLAQSGGGTDSSKVSFFQWLNCLQPHGVGRDTLSVFKDVMDTLSDEDAAEIEAIQSRLFHLCAMTEKLEAKPRILVDAEHTRLQPFIRAVTIEAMKRFNTEGRSLVYNTYQAYLKSTQSQLETDLELTRRLGVTLAVKLVRGAYMDFERKAAEKQGHASPVHDCIEDTHRCYDSCAHLLLTNIDRTAVFLGTHNAESLRKAAEMLFDICEKRNNAVTDQGSTPSSALSSSADDIVTPAALPVSFGQLLGMGDHLTYTLSSMGLKVYKYVPYGPVQVTIPYLLRRAQENVGMMGGAGRELRFVFDEVKRRLRRSV